jgi:Flp pilus assembly protein TadB
VGAAEAYLQGGAALLLVVFVGAAFTWLLRRLDRAEQRADKIQGEKEDIYKASVELLKSYQSRDTEALRAYQEQERRRRDMEAIR